MRCFRWWLSAVLVLVCGCVDERGYSWTSVPVSGPAAGDFVGRWYTEEGHLELVVRQPGPEGVEAWLLAPETYRPIVALANPGVLTFTIDGPDGAYDVDLKIIHWEEPFPGVADTCLYSHHNFWLFRDPSPAWLAGRGAERWLRSASLRAESLMDWLVREL